MDTTVEFLRSFAWLLFWLIVLPLGGLFELLFTISDELITLLPRPRWATL